MENKITSINQNYKRKENIRINKNSLELYTEKDFKDIIDNRDVKELGQIVMDELFKSLEQFKFASSNKEAVDAISLFSNSIDLLQLQLLSIVNGDSIDQLSDSFDKEMEDLFKDLAF